MSPDLESPRRGTQMLNGNLCPARHTAAGQLRNSEENLFSRAQPDLPAASASPDMIGWSRVLLSHGLDAVLSY